MNENELRLIRMADVELQKVDWLWFPFIPFGKISMIQGDPGEGKRRLPCVWRRRVRRGTPFRTRLHRSVCPSMLSTKRRRTAWATPLSPA